VSASYGLDPMLRWLQAGRSLARDRCWDSLERCRQTNVACPFTDAFEPALEGVISSMRTTESLHWRFIL
jgi:hypothetical protein